MGTIWDDAVGILLKLLAAAVPFGLIWLLGRWERRLERRAAKGSKPWPSNDDWYGSQ
jgi:hypothetical protein